jgi:CBS domain containing-hemolysin-like protein
MVLKGYLVTAGVVLFAGASFFFAVAESALFALGKWRARQMAEQPGGDRVARLLENPAELLATIALGNTIANGAIVALGLWPALSGQWPLGWTLLATAALILVGCEIVPKTLAVRAPEPWALWVARPILLLQRVTGWLQRLFQRFNGWLLGVVMRGVPKLVSGVTDDEYRELVELAFQQGTLAQAEKEIILQIISLDRKTAKDVMKPRSQMTMIPDDLAVEDMIATARKCQHRRLPIYDEAEDTIVGVLNTGALLLDPGMDLADAIEFPSFVPASMNLLHLLNSLEKQQRGLAVVLDEFGGLAGLVTIEDIMAEVVGRFRSEIEPTGFVVETLGPGRWRVNGLMRVEDFRREHPELGDVPGVDTMGGLMVSQMEVVPVAGESLAFRGLKLTVHLADDRRVKELVVEVIRKK